MSVKSLAGKKYSREIHLAIAEAIRDGELQAGEALPSVRALATELRVSPGTISLAYRTLRERGLITVGDRKRARVAAKPAVPTAGDLPVGPGVRDLRTVAPDSELLPDIHRFAGAGARRSGSYDTQNVTAELSESMGPLFEEDGIRGHLTATNGAHDAIERICQAAIPPGSTIAVEDPGWVAGYSLLRTMGYTLAGVEVDAHGIVPSSLDTTLARHNCAMVLLQPRAQNPTGATLNSLRAKELREVLESYPDCYVLEDDHVSLTSGAPAFSLTRGRRRWAVVRSVSKIFGPDLRLAVVSSDRTTADLVQGRQLLGPGWVSHLVQRLVAAMLSDSKCLETVERAADLYRARREEFVGHLASRGIDVLSSSGFTVTIPVGDESAVTAELMARGWAVRGGELSRLSSPPFVRVCTSDLTADEARRLADDVSGILRSVPRGRAL
ncbi:aminotransferase class I/II-fold pyridoxal phosphate-dependent enzyme [Amycolatopsis acidicola]|uniref:Aminotransferase class I/II-fold pyridoxal phosphate-dependent enzyme n=1 Tax=Amycolatopsis acidicola TaxID=2596893 RepID=A0A5N0UYY9_9PSEU|nr:aminotransferase class I/II-fold pyridoxal phosphate-dependent enzyme [Amycolatopsis acidicola]KAA9159064.1 aminotransferase class I/II-fold pyridoxal phosphate-dependent enzyme [Amycolatopsis acidicola]